MGKSLESHGFPELGEEPPGRRAIAPSHHRSLPHTARRPPRLGNSAGIRPETIERAYFPHTGFSGFMQPVLEDSVLAKRAAEGTLTVKDLLLYSAVCGTGLDTVPLPGETTAEQLFPLLLDVCALAVRLDKPLTARLMPVPGKQAGDETSFNFGFFANSRIMGPGIDRRNRLFRRYGEFPFILTPVMTLPGNLSWNQLLWLVPIHCNWAESSTSKAQGDQLT